MYKRQVHESEDSIGKIRGFIGSHGIFVRTYAYILANGRQGLREVSEGAVANSRYIYELSLIHISIAIHPGGQPVCKARLIFHSRFK